ncbi:hypothetical protein F183_A50150 [Bryobacterales bacterium F-183]|nr:hypothetical protein F183_A50150 [Bryobacterales bacterium F-183]
MSKVDSTESQDFPAPAPKSSQTGKSAAASRILRAVEMGRAQQQAAAPAAPPSAEALPEQSGPVAEPEPAQESLRSLSAATSSTAQDQAPDTASKDDTSSPRVSATKAGLAAKQAAAKQAASGAKPAEEEAAPQSPVAQAVRARAEAKSKDEKAGKTGKSAAKKKEAIAPAEVPFVGEVSPSPSFWAKLSTGAKIGIFAALLVIAGGGAYFLSQKGAAKAKAIAPAGPQFVPLTGAGGWNPKWAGDAAKPAGRSISVFRPSQPLANYRIEFEGQIESKALGWVFRAQDPKNYYAYKLEIVKPGLDQIVALSRSVIINGNETQRHYTPLKTPVRPGHTFRIRMDAKGSEFNTWIGDELVEVFQDDRLQTGAVGLLQDKDERAQLHKVQIFEMR